MLKYRSVFISDIHLGTRGCNAEYLLDFLNHIESDYLYLVGDIIDLWNVGARWYWPSLHSQIVRIVIDKAQAGTRVVYIPGNHDELIRNHTGLDISGVEIELQAVHETVDGRRFLVLHGDEFDGVVCNNKWLAHLGSGAYDLLLVLNRWFNVARRKLGFPYWSLSAYLKYKVKNAVNFVSAFESALQKAAHDKSMNGVICGHIHRAAHIPINDRFTYCNCGDWVESCTALVEDAAGQLSILDWPKQSFELLNQNEKIEDPVDQRRLETTD